MHDFGIGGRRLWMEATDVDIWANGRGYMDSLSVTLDGDDVLIGNRFRDIVNGYAGNDTIATNGGNDRLIGGPGADTLRGGSGADLLQGGRGTDRLSGGGGTDVLDGGYGTDSLAGGRGADSFVFGRGYGRDSIVDFKDDIDTLRLDDRLWKGALTKKQVIETFAEVAGDDLVLAFRTGKLVIQDFTDARNLWDDLQIV